MDLFNSLSRWIICKRVEMHKFFEQWAQGYPRTERSVVGGTAKRLTHAQPEGGVLNILKHLPLEITGSGVSSVRYPYQTPDFTMGTYDSQVSYPVVGPKTMPCSNNKSMYQTPIQCLGGNPGAVKVEKCRQGPMEQPNVSASNHHYQNGFKNEHIKSNKNSMPESANFQAEISKSPFWKHIFAPPFTPASAKKAQNHHLKQNHREPSGAKFTPTYPYVQYVGPPGDTIRVPALPNIGPVNSYPWDRFHTREPCYKAQSVYEHPDYPAFTPQASCVPPAGSAPLVVPYLVQFTCQQFPVQVHQYVFASSPTQANYQREVSIHIERKPVNHQRSDPNLCLSKTTPYEASSCQNPNVQERTASSNSTDYISSVSELADGIQTVQISPGLNRTDNLDAEKESSKLDPCPSSEACHSQIEEAPNVITEKPDCDTSPGPLSSEICELSKADQDSGVACASKIILEETNDKEDCNSPTLQTTKHQSATNKLSMTQQQGMATPVLSQRKKRKSRPSAEKRRRRRMGGVCSVKLKSEPGETVQSSKKQNTKHEPRPTFSQNDTSSMSATVALILGLGSDEESYDELVESTTAQHEKVKTYCFSISSCSDSDSDFDDISCSDTTDGIPDEATWAQLNISLNPLNLSCLTTTPKAIQKTVSSPELARCTSPGFGPTGLKKSLPRSPTVSISLSKHVKFASGDNLVTVHTIEDDLGAYQEARKGPWELYALDRFRFKNRAEEIEKSISWIFDAGHRRRVWDCLQHCDFERVKEAASIDCNIVKQATATDALRKKICM